MMDSETNSGKPSFRKKAGSGVSLAGFIVGVGAVFLLYAARAYYVASVDEDTLISLRYARNLIDGNGLVWNTGGERVEGITNLLWTLILAGFSWLSGIELPTVSLALGMLCGALTLLVAYLWCRAEIVAGGFSRSGATYGALTVPLLLVLAPGFVFYSASGLETPFFALLVTGGLYTLSHAGSLRWYAAGGALLGAAALTRPEGALVLAFGIGTCLLASGGRARKVAACALPGLAIVAVATLWRLWYYGSPVPNTFFVRAKGLEVIEQWGWPYLEQAALASWFHVAWLLAVGGALLSWKFLVRNLAVLALVPVWSAYVLYAGGDYMPAFRLIVPILPAVYVLAVAGGFRIYRTMFAPGDSPMPARLAVLGLPVLALTMFAALQLPVQLAAERQHKIDNDRWTEYRRSVGEALESRDPDALVAANAVGALGYYSDLRILDMLGLNNAYIARHGSRDPEQFPGHQVGDGRYVLSREPDYIIPYGIKPIYRVDQTAPYFVGDRELASLPEFHAEYEAITIELNNDVEEYGGQEASLFRRKSGVD
jgi:arabinofuranosyltransferase